MQDDKSMNEAIRIREYRGYDIQYNRPDRNFEAVKDSVVKLTAKAEDDLWTKIDNAVKRLSKVAKSKLLPMEIIYKDYSNPKLAIITGVAEDGDVWITHRENGENKRKKLTTKWSKYDYYPRTDTNLKTFAEVAKQKELIKKATEQISTLLGQFVDPIDVQELANPQEE